MKHKFFILLSVFALVSLFVFFWWQQAVKPFDSTNSTSSTFTITRGETVRTIAERLQKQNLIRSSVAFFILTRFGGLADKLQAGEFRLSPTMNLSTIADTLTHGTMDARITIPEGLRKEEIATLVARSFSIPESEFIKRANEGYLFPDTYLIPKDATLDVVLTTLSKNFENRVTSDIKQRAQQKNLSLEEVLIIASLIEREAKFEADRPIVASVILNRLKIDMKLDIDATIQYALGYQPKEKTWWKKDLTLQDLEIDSPYNTYTNAGLPAGPISNPGLAAIKAVIEAPQSDYLYYISDKSGKIHPAQTIEEHNTNISKYLNQ